MDDEVCLTSRSVRSRYSSAARTSSSRRTWSSGPWARVMSHAPRPRRIPSSTRGANASDIPSAGTVSRWPLNIRLGLSLPGDHVCPIVIDRLQLGADPAMRGTIRRGIDRSVPPDRGRLCGSRWRSGVVRTSKSVVLRRLLPSLAHHFFVGVSLTIREARRASCAFSRSLNFWIFPDWVIGNSSTIST